MSRFLTRTVTRLARCSAQRLVRASLAPNIFAHNLQSVQNTFPVCSEALRRQYSSESNSIHEKIDGFVKNAKVVVFMKGEQTAPQCGFSNAVVQIMRMHDVTFESHNVLADDDVRQGIKEYSNWPTIPQVFFDGEFVGGCDILLQMHQSGELIEELDKIGIKSALGDAPQKN